MMIRFIAFLLFIISCSAWARRPEGLLPFESENCPSKVPLISIRQPIKKSNSIGQLISATGDTFDVSILNLEDAEKLFERMRYFPLLARNYLKSSESICHATAQKISVLLQNQGIFVGKVFAEGHLKPQVNGIFYPWKYHVAPLILVERSNQLSVFVIDPALFTRVVTLDEWTAKLTEVPGSSITSIYFAPRFNYLPQCIPEQKGTFLNYTAEDLDNADQLLLKAFQQRN